VTGEGSGGNKQGACDKEARKPFETHFLAPQRLAAEILLLITDIEEKMLLG
jgi:hypothetical protein